MQELPGKISRDNFKKILAGNKKYFPVKLAKDLKAAGMGSYLFKTRLSKDQALKAIRYLQSQGKIPKFKAPSSMYQKAATWQREQDLAAQAAIRQKHVRTQIAIDLGEELSAEERGKSLTHYDPRSVLGKKPVSQIDAEKQKQEKTAADRKQKQEKSLQSQRPTPAMRQPKKDDLFEDELVEMDI
ncbi:MAG: hypothetical protein WCW26_00980 [Candidatus Buchananbacteria bacterium]